MCQESAWAAGLSPKPVLQHGGLVLLCPCGVLPRFSRCKLRKDFTLRLLGLSWYLPLAAVLPGRGSFSLLTLGTKSPQPDLHLCGTGIPIPRIFRFLSWGVTGELPLSSCFVLPISGEVKRISGFSASVHFKYETKWEITSLLGKALETELNKKNTGLKCTHSCLILSTVTAWGFEGLFWLW